MVNATRASRCEAASHNSVTVAQLVLAVTHTLFDCFKSTPEVQVAGLSSEAKVWPLRPVRARQANKLCQVLGVRRGGGPETTRQGSVTQSNRTWFR